MRVSEPPQDLHQNRKPTIFHEASSWKKRRKRTNQNSQGDEQNFFLLLSSLLYLFSFILLLHLKPKKKIINKREADHGPEVQKKLERSHTGEKKKKNAIVIHPSPVTLNCRLTVCIMYLCATIKTRRKKAMRSWFVASNLALASTPTDSKCSHAHIFTTIKKAQTVRHQNSALTIK